MTTRNAASALSDLIDIKLTQANAVCNAARLARDAHTDTTISYALWAATDLIEEAIKAFNELRDIDNNKEQSPKEVQS